MSVADCYLRVKQQVEEIAKSCGRNPREISLVAVTKGRSLDLVLAAYEAGCRDFGENKIQEALEKIPEAPKDLQWHFIGTLQKNKVRKAIGKFVLIHSVDTLELAKKISECGVEANVEAPILLQVNTSGEQTKHGFTPKELTSSIEVISRFPGISVKGLMTMAPFVEDEKVVRKCFRDLRKLRDQLQDIYPQLQELSMGMTHDYKIAIEEGATILRIGTAIFQASGLI